MLPHYQKPYRNSTLFYIELSLNTFKNYISLIEDTFENKIKDSRVWAEGALKKINENNETSDKDYESHLSDSVIEQVYQLEVEFINRFRSSIIIQLYSFLEVELKSYCEKHSKENLKEYSINDLKGSNEIDKIKKYLKQSANIDLSKVPGWDFINNLRTIRNKIVHNESLVKLFNHNEFKAINYFAQNNFTLKPYSDEEEKIVLDKKEFIGLCLKQVETFLVAILVIS